MHAIAMVHKMQRLALSTGSSISAIHTEQDEEADDRIDHQSTVSDATNATAATAAAASAPIDKATDKTVDTDVPVAQ